MHDKRDSWFWLSRPVCDFCGLICGVVWFQQQSPSANQKKGAEEATELPQNVVKGGTLVLCVKCYADGNIPNILSTQDFTKIDLITKLNSSSSRPVKGQNNWSQEETLRLLDLISKFNDDWNEIQRHYPSRTKEDLILHFLQMPAKNVTSISLMEANDQIDDKRTTEKTTDPNISCLSDYSNPLLQHVTKKSSNTSANWLHLRSLSSKVYSKELKPKKRSKAAMQTLRSQLEKRPTAQSERRSFKPRKTSTAVLMANQTMESQSSWIQMLKNSDRRLIIPIKRAQLRRCLKQASPKLM